MHFTGSPLWDLSCPEIKKLENSWNVVIRKTFNLPFNTHKYFIEPVSNMVHLKKMLFTRFISFIRQIGNSKKLIPKQLLNIIRYDTRSITGSNIRKLFLMTGISKTEDIDRYKIDDLPLYKIPNDDKWKIGILSDILERRNGDSLIGQFEDEECEEILNFICCS